MTVQKTDPQSDRPAGEATNGAGQPGAGPTAGDTDASAPKRVFVYNGSEYPDPDPQLTPDQIRRELARFVPELTNADVREETRQDGTVQFVFSRRIGTKGVAVALAEHAPAPEVAGAEEPAIPSAGRRLATLLIGVRGTRLEILRLAHELALPDGEFDLDAAAARGPELERACDQAEVYSRAVRALREALGAFFTR